jgi:hypothetical protein
MSCIGRSDSKEDEMEREREVIQKERGERELFFFLLEIIYWVATVQSVLPKGLGNLKGICCGSYFVVFLKK